MTVLEYTLLVFLVGFGFGVYFGVRGLKDIKKRIREWAKE